ncbi:MAG TPA: GNAT family N-acetyltransferase [Anaerolineales bacterium]
MQFTLHANFAEIAPEKWNGLSTGGISDTPFARHEYLKLWWETRGGGEWPQAELFLISASENGRLAGIAPLFTADHDGRKALLLVGSIEISDYLDLIVRAEELGAFTKGLLDFITEIPGLQGLPLDLYDIADSSPTLAVLAAEAAQRGWKYDEQIYRPTPRIALAADFETYLTGLDKKQRHEIRRKLRRASEGPTPANFELLEQAEQLDASIEQFLELMTHDDNKKRFLSPEMRDHMRALMHVAWDAGYLWMAFLTVGGMKAAAVLNFDHRNKLWGYNSAVNREYTELSPGWVLLAHQIRWACEHRRNEFDFMRGDEDYKYRFGAVNQHVMRVRIDRA